MRNLMRKQWLNLASLLCALMFAQAAHANHNAFAYQMLGKAIEVAKELNPEGANPISPGGGGGVHGGGNINPPAEKLGHPIRPALEELAEMETAYDDEQWIESVAGMDCDSESGECMDLWADSGEEYSSEE